MAFWNKIFKQKSEQADDPAPREHAEKKEPLQKMETPGSVRTSALPAQTGVLLYPRVTEKSSGMAGERKFVFAVSERASKRDVARAVQARFGVHAESVRVIRTRGKERRRGRQIGWKAGIKKAIVHLREGETIEIT